MALEEDLENLREAALRRIPLDRTPSGAETFEVTATVLVSHEEPIEESMRESLAKHLAARASKAIEDKQAEGRTPLGITSSRLEYSPRPRVGTALTAAAYHLVLGVAAAGGTPRHSQSDGR